MAPAVMKIFELPVEKRIDAFIERWKDLDEFTGCRTASEQNEMAEIVVTHGLNGSHGVCHGITGGG